MERASVAYPTKEKHGVTYRLNDLAFLSGTVFCVLAMFYPVFGISPSPYIADTFGLPTGFHCHLAFKVLRRSTLSGASGSCQLQMACPPLVLALSGGLYCPFLLRSSMVCRRGDTLVPQTLLSNSPPASTCNI